MSASDPIETGRDRAALTRQAGIGKLSFISVLAGVLVAYGAFAVLVALAGAAAAAIGLTSDLSANNWAELGVGSAIVVAVVAAVTATQADTSAIRGNLRSLGIPTTGAEWGEVGTLAGIGSLAAMLVGAVLGGMLGERWHTKLTRRAASPKYGPDREQPATDDRGATAPARDAADRDRADRDRAEQGRSEDGGATRIDQDRPRS